MIPGHCHGQAWEAASWEGFLAYCETSGQEKTAFSALKVAFIPTLGSGFGKQGPFGIAVESQSEEIKYKGLTLRVKGTD